MKKILSIILAALMVATTLFALPFNAFAISQSDVNGAKEVTVSSTPYSDENVAPTTENNIYYKITVAETGVYALCSTRSDTASPDTYGTLYSADFKEIAHNDDGTDRNFKIVWYLEKGNTYYLGARYFSSSYIGQAFNITIEKDNNSVVFDKIMYTKYTEDDETSEDPDAVTTYYTVTNNFLNSPTNVTIKNTVNGYPVKRIGRESFENCQYITSLTIQEGIEVIERFAFSNCVNLASINLCNSITELQNASFNALNYNGVTKNITLPASLEIYESAFSYAGTESFSISSKNKNFKTENGILYSADKTVLYEYPCKKAADLFTVPKGVTQIADFAFAGSEIKKIALSDTVVELGENAFSYSKIAEINLNEGLRKINFYAFAGTELTELNLPSTIDYIGGDIIEYTNIVSIVIPDVKGNLEIGEAFLRSDIKNAIIKCKTAKISSKAFDNDTTIYGYAGSTAEEYANTNDNTFVTIPEIAAEECTEHIYCESKLISAPTCKKEGSCQTACVVCGKKGANTKLPKIEHNFMSGTCVYCLMQEYPQYRLDVNKSVTGLFDYESEAVVIFKPEKGGTYTINLENANYAVYARVNIFDKNGRPAGYFELTNENNMFTTYPLQTGEYVIILVENDSGNKDDISFTMSAKCNHNYSVKTTKATTKADGKTVKTCKSCGETVTTVIPKIASVNLSATSYTYNAKAKTPSVTVKDSKGKVLTKNTDYTVSYPTGRTNVGKYSVKITFKGKYSGTATKTFTIKPKATSLTTVTATSKGFTAKWSKQASQTTGYELQYSTSSKFTNPVTTTISKNSTTSKTISKLSGKKKYYVRVRTYKVVKVNGKSTKVYSNWSTAKSVTTKA